MTSSSPDFNSAYANLLKKFPSGGDVEFMDTGSIILNSLTGGGYPRGRLIEIHSLEGVGKSTAMWHSLASLADAGMRTVVIDAEFAVNDNLLNGIGCREHVDHGMIALHKANVWGEVQEIIESYRSIKNKLDRPVAFAIDSITSVVSCNAAKDDLSTNAEIGVDARLQSRFFKIYKGPMFRENFSMVIVNQMRMKMDARFNATVARAGGKALAHFCDVIIGLRSSGKIEEDGQIIGSVVTAMSEKNKFVSPFLKRKMHIIFGRGISDRRTVKDLLVEAGIVKQSGAYFKCEEKMEKAVLGNAGLVDWIDENWSWCISKLKETGVL